MTRRKNKEQTGGNQTVADGAGGVVAPLHETVTATAPPVAAPRSPPPAATRPDTDGPAGSAATLSASAKKRNKKKKAAAAATVSSEPVDPYQGLNTSQKKNAKRRAAKRKAAMEDPAVQRTDANVDDSFDPLDDARRAIIENFSSRLAMCFTDSKRGDEALGKNQAVSHKAHIESLMKDIDAKIALDKPSKPKSTISAAALHQQLLDYEGATALSSEEAAQRDWIKRDFEAAKEWEASRKLAASLQKIRDEAAAQLTTAKVHVSETQHSQKSSEALRRFCALRGIDVLKLPDSEKLKTGPVELSVEVANALNGNPNLMRIIEKRIRAVLQRPTERRAHVVQLTALESIWKDCAAELHKVDFSGLQTIHVEPQAIGAIIGPGGRNAQQLEKDFEVFVRADQASVTLYGSKQNVEKAREAITQLLEEAQTAETVQVPAAVAMLLSAQGNAQLKDIMQKSQADIRLQIRDAPRGTPPSVPAVIRGKAEVIAAARRLLGEVASSVKSSVVEVPPAVMPILFGGQGGGQQESRNPEAPKPDRSLQDAFRRLPSASKVVVKRTGTSIIISGANQKEVDLGKREVEALLRKAQLPVSTIAFTREQARIVNLEKRKAIETKHHVSLTLVGDSLQLRGESANIQSAVNDIESTLNTRGERKVIPLKVEVMTKMIRERRVAQFEKDAGGVSLSLDKKAGTATIVGSSETIERAETMLREAEEKEARLARDTITREIPCTTPIVVIGPGGATVKRIRQQTGAKINIMDERRVVEITGPSEAVEKAQKSIEQLLKSHQEATEKAAAATNQENGGEAATKAPTSERQERRASPQNASRKPANARNQPPATHKITSETDFPSLTGFGKGEANGNVSSTVATQPTDEVAVVPEGDEVEEVNENIAPSAAVEVSAVNGSA